MTAAAIRAEVAAALAEASAAVGDGPLIVTLVRTAGGPQTPWDTSAFTETAETSLRAVVGRYDRRLVDGTLIMAGDRRVMVEAGPVEPTTADRLRIGGEDYAIVAVRPLAPGGVALMYEVQVRR